MNLGVMENIKCHTKAIAVGSGGAGDSGEAGGGIETG